MEALQYRFNSSKGYLQQIYKKSIANIHLPHSPLHYFAKHFVGSPYITSPSHNRQYTLFLHIRSATHSIYSHAQVPCTLPWSSSASVSNILMLKSTSFSLHPVQRSTTSTSILLFRPCFASKRVMRIFFPHRGLWFGFESTATASNTRWESAHIASWEVFSKPQAP